MVIRTRQYLAAVIPQGDILVMNTLRYAAGLRDPKDLDLPGDQKISAKEIDLALRLIKDMEEKWKPEQYKDTYREDLLKRIEEKVKAGQTEEITPPSKEKEKAGADVIDLMSLLRKSVEGGKKAPKKAQAKKRRAA